jgi:CRP-like cAMP-binding protein
MDTGLGANAEAGWSRAAAEVPERLGLAATLSRYLTLTDGELAAVTQLQANTQHLPRRRDLIREGQSSPFAYILCDGIISRYRVLPNGRRQIMGFGFAGDMVGFPSCLFARAAGSVCCVTDVVVAPVPTEQLSALFMRHPRIGAALFWAVGRQAAFCNERLVAVGRRGAEERVAYLALELLAMQDGASVRDGERFRFPLTQEMIADAVGLSTQHVNRTLRTLRQRRLLVLDGHWAEILDAQGLITMASFDPMLLQPVPIPGL